MIFSLCLTNKAYLELEGGASYKLTIEVWRTVERGTGSGKVGQR